MPPSLLGSFPGACASDDDHDDDDSHRLPQLSQSPSPPLRPSSDAPVNNLDNGLDDDDDDDDEHWVDAIDSAGPSLPSAPVLLRHHSLSSPFRARPNILRLSHSPRPSPSGAPLGMPPGLDLPPSSPLAPRGSNTQFDRPALRPARLNRANSRRATTLRSRGSRASLRRPRSSSKSAQDCSSSIYSFKSFQTSSTDDLAGFEDASDQAEWMDIDGGGAYEDLDRAEEIVKKISRLSAIHCSSLALRSALQARHGFSGFSDGRSPLSGLAALGTCASPTPACQGSLCRFSSTSSRASPNPSPTPTHHPQSCRGSLNSARWRSSDSSASSRPECATPETSVVSDQAPSEPVRHGSRAPNPQSASFAVPVFTRVCNPSKPSAGYEGPPNPSLTPPLVPNQFPRRQTPSIGLPLGNPSPEAFQSLSLSHQRLLRPPSRSPPPCHHSVNSSWRRKPLLLRPARASSFVNVGKTITSPDTSHSPSGSVSPTSARPKSPRNSIAQSRRSDSLRWSLPASTFSPYSSPSLILFSPPRSSSLRSSLEGSSQASCDAQERFASSKEERNFLGGRRTFTSPFPPSIRVQDSLSIESHRYSVLSRVTPQSFEPSQLDRVGLSIFIGGDEVTRIREVTDYQFAGSPQSTVTSTFQDPDIVRRDALAAQISLFSSEKISPVSSSTEQANGIPHSVLFPLPPLSPTSQTSESSTHSVSFAPGSFVARDSKTSSVAQDQLPEHSSSVAPTFPSSSEPRLPRRSRKAALIRTTLSQVASGRRSLSLTSSTSSQGSRNYRLMSGSKPNPASTEPRQALRRDSVRSLAASLPQPARMSGILVAGRTRKLNSFLLLGRITTSSQAGVQPVPSCPSMESPVQGPATYHTMTGEDAAQFYATHSATLSPLPATPPMLFGTEGVSATRTSPARTVEPQDCRPPLPNVGVDPDPPNVRRGSYLPGPGGPNSLTKSRGGVKLIDVRRDLQTELDLEKTSTRLRKIRGKSRIISGPILIDKRDEDRALWGMICRS